MKDAERAQVTVLSLGGTVAMTSQEGSGARPSVTAAGLIAAVPGLDARADVTTETLSSVPSASLRIRDLVEILPRLESACAGGADGLVVTTGTDTLEEVAYLFDLLWRREEPLVVTGAMRTADAAGSDGPANLLSAVTVAASRAARGYGCVVVVNDDVHSGRGARKAHATRPDAFVSAGFAPLGRVQEGQVHLRPPDPRQTLPLRHGADIPKVALLRLTLDQDTDLLDHAAATCDGIVVEVFGAGHVPEWWVDALEAARVKVPIAVTSRTGAGALLRRSYGFRGSERDLTTLGLHFLDDMDGVKARILLMVALMTSASREEVDDIMAGGHGVGAAMSRSRS